MGFLSGIVSGSFDIVTGIGQMASAGDIGREKKKLLEVKAEYNRKQIEKAYAENYSKQMSQYANSLSDILNQKDIGISNINVASTDVGAVDIQGSSFRSTAIAQLNNEFNTAMNNLNDNQYNSNIALAQEKNQQIMQVNLDSYNARQNVNMETQAQKTEGFSKVIMGMAKVGDAYLGSPSTETMAESGVGNVGTGQLINPDKDKLTFNALSKSVKGDNRLSLKYFGGNDNPFIGGGNF